MNNPQMYQQLNNLRNNGTDPQTLIQQMVNKSSPEQMQGILNQARSLGVPDNILAQIQNMKNG